MTWLLLLNIWQRCRFYPVLHPLPWVQNVPPCVRAHTGTHKHTHSCMCVYMYILPRTPVRHGFSCFYMYGALLLVQICLPHPRFTHVCTHTSEPEGFYYCMSWTLFDVQICPSPPALGLTHTQIHIYACTHALPHTSSRQHGFSCHYVCWQCCASSSLLPPTQHTACWSCWEGGNQLVWSCSSQFGGGTVFIT